MDTNQAVYRIKTSFITLSQGIRCAKLQDVVTGKKLYRPIIIRKMLSKQFKKISEAEEYAQQVLKRYQRLLVAKARMEKDKENDV